MGYAYWDLVLHFCDKTGYILTRFIVLIIMLVILYLVNKKAAMVNLPPFQCHVVISEEWG